jgi:ABC-type glycerol-3-phosphate transport system substrate-binding protein
VQQVAAWLFLRWLLSPENQAQWVEATDLFPLRASVSALVGPYRAASPQWEAAVNLLPTALGVPHQASWGKVRYVLEDGANLLFQANLPSGQIPSLLDEMQSLADGISAGH